MEVPDRRLAEDPRARVVDAHRGIRHRRSVGRSADAAARGATSLVFFATVSLHAPAGDGDGVLEPGLRAARPHHRQRLRAALQGLRSAIAVRATRHDIHRPTTCPLRPLSVGRSATAGRTTPGSSSRRWRTGRLARWAASRRARHDYAKWVAYLLSAWPPRDGADSGPVRRSSVRELSQGANFPSVRVRPGSSGPDACREASTYAMGFYAASDCELGLTLSHGGGYPGYGSHVLLLPDYGVGIFALANRTYAGPRPPVWDAAVTLLRAGRLKPRSSQPSSALASTYAAVTKMFLGGLGDLRGRCVRDEFSDGPRRGTLGARDHCAEGTGRRPARQPRRSHRRVRCPASSCGVASAVASGGKCCSRPLRHSAFSR